MRSMCALLMVAIATLPALLGAAEPQVAHMVYFTLNEDTQENRDRLVASAQEHLSGHEGVVYFSVGTQSDAFQGQVNDRDFDVALHVVFSSQAALKSYSSHPRHMTFLRENRAMFAQVRVFDSLLAARASEEDEP